jgi:hypothetical protein
MATPLRPSLLGRRRDAVPARPGSSSALHPMAAFPSADSATAAPARHSQPKSARGSDSAHAITDLIAGQTSALLHGGSHEMINCRRVLSPGA